jgi:hypothetical protein
LTGKLAGAIFRDHAGDYIGGAASRVRHDDAYWLGRKILR